MRREVWCCIIFWQRNKWISINKLHWSHSLCPSLVHRSMSGPERDGDSWARRHGTREGQPDPLLPGISEEEERQRPHPSLVLLPAGRCRSGRPLAAGASAAHPVPHRQDGHQEAKAVRELHPSLPQAEVPAVWGEGGRGVPAVHPRRDGRRPGLLQLQGAGDP